MQVTVPQGVISTILKHDAKATSYKIALLRSINDVVLSFPGLHTFDQDVAIPLRVLAEYWLAYYWPFVDTEVPIMQGPRSMRNGRLANDMAFRTELAAFRSEWEETWRAASRPSDGFWLISELRVPRKRKTYSVELLKAYDRAIKAISRTIQMPIRYAGPGQWSVFERPTRYSQLAGRVVAVPNTYPEDVCLVISADLWRAFQQMSLYVEALCIHEWCLFTEKVEQKAEAEVDRGRAYSLLTDRPDNRRPLTWERNQVDLLLMEGVEFICPWTERRIRKSTKYDLDHLLPVSIYPTNEMWNLAPSDPVFNSHTKRNRVPKVERLQRAQPHLGRTYTMYEMSVPLAEALREDVDVRFVTVQTHEAGFPDAVAGAVVEFIDQVGVSRNLARF
jgi:hypothetical protein